MYVYCSIEKNYIKNADNSDENIIHAQY